QDRGAVFGVAVAAAAIVGGDHLEGGLTLWGGGVAALGAVAQQRQLGGGGASTGDAKPPGLVRAHAQAVEVVGLAAEDQGVGAPRIVVVAASADVPLAAADRIDETVGVGIRRPLGPARDLVVAGDPDAGDRVAVVTEDELGADEVGAREGVSVAVAQHEGVTLDAQPVKTPGRGGRRGDDPQELDPGAVGEA